MNTPSSTIPDMTVPSTSSTFAFLAVVTLVVGAYCTFFVRAYRERPRGAFIAIAAFVGWIAISGWLARSGVLLSLRGSPRLAFYLVGSLGMAWLLALSPAGRRIVSAVPLAWLVAFQGFRVPLEFVLHSFYQQGTLPVQMTFEGHNFDIVTGAVALVVAATLNWGSVSTAVRWRLTLAFNLLGMGLLLAVIRIAVLSTPWPLRSYMNDPPVQLAFHAPYTWILTVCVAGALWGHVLVFRWLWFNRAFASSSVAQPATPSPQ